MDAKISVIVPIYKVEKYLRKCINSILNQTYPNLEIILVNDGSPDGCGEICDSYALQDDRVKVIHKKNGGLSDARNKGLLIATGEYISFIDSDDYIDEVFYEVLLNLILTNDADIAQCDFMKIYESDSSINKVSICKDEEILILKNYESLEKLYDENHEITVVVWNKLYRRAVLQEIYFPFGKIHEDDFTTYKVLYNANKIVLTSKKMYYYLQRDDSIMGRWDNKEFNPKNLVFLETYYNQIIFYKEKGLMKLSDVVTERLEIYIRVSLNEISYSKLDGKNAYFSHVVNFYKDKFQLFNKGPKNPRLTIMRTIFYISPKFIIKMICNFISIHRTKVVINE